MFTFYSLVLDVNSAYVVYNYITYLSLFFFLPTDRIGQSNTLMTCCRIAGHDLSSLKNNKSNNNKSWKGEETLLGL